MPNMAKLISRHNLAVEKEATPPPPQPGCNCLKKGPPCPLNGQCKEACIVYKATVTREDNGKVETYTGLTSRMFKKRLYEQHSDFRHDETASKLSGYIWELKRRNAPFKIAWEKITSARPFNPVTKKCSLCLQEKFNIMFHKDGASLNSRNELFNTCRHRRKKLLSNFS